MDVCAHYGRVCTIIIASLRPMYTAKELCPKYQTYLNVMPVSKVLFKHDLKLARNNANFLNVMSAHCNQFVEIRAT